MTEPVIYHITTNQRSLIYVTTENKKNPKVDAYLRDHVHKSISVIEVSVIRITPYGLFVSHNANEFNVTTKNHIPFSAFGMLQEIIIN